MENMHQLALAAIAASFVMLTLTSLRIGLRSRAARGWVATEGFAQGVAILATIAIACSLAFTSYALSPHMPVGIAILGAFALHVGIMMLCHTFLIARVTQGASREMPELQRA